jgi:DNA-binding response OmpR family regulator
MPRVLVVDDDEETCTAMAVGLRRAYRKVVAATDARAALTLSRKLLPHLVITDVGLPTMTGWELVRELRATPETKRVSVIFLTPHDRESDRIRGLRLGAVDVLSKPLSLVELELRVQNALRAESAARRASVCPAESGFAGSLATLPLPSLLTTLAADRKSGELRLASGADEVRLLLRDGAIIQARRARGAACGATECVLSTLRWTQGRFGFAERPVIGDDQVHESVTALLMEAARRQDEAARTCARSA